MCFAVEVEETLTGAVNKSMELRSDFLTPEQRMALVARHRREKDPRHADRIKAILALDAGYFPAIMEMLLLDDHSIRRHFETFMKDGLEVLLSDGYQPHQGKLTQKEKARLRRFLLGSVVPSVAPVIAFMKGEFDKEYSVSGAASLLRSMGFAYKKPVRIPGKADSAAQRGFIEEFDRLMAEKERGAQVWFVDGVHPPHNSQPAHGWLPKGENDAVMANAGRGRVNINGTINVESREVAHVECESVNAQSTVELLREIGRRSPKRAKAIVICDNARYYSSSVVKKYLKRATRVELRFLPAYSPNLNSIERLWRFMKKTVCHNRYHATLGGFRGALLEFFAWLGDKYRDQLKTLITTNFHVIDPAKVRVIGDA